MRIKEGDEWKMVFRTQYGHFKYQGISFGLFNAPASFQGYINKILAKKPIIFIIVYQDDIFTYTKDPNQAHVNDVWWALKELRKHSLLAKLKKCQFHKDKIRFLKYVVSDHRIRIEDERIKIVKNWPKSKFVRDI